MSNERLAQALRELRSLVVDWQYDKDCPAKTASWLDKALADHEALAAVPVEPVVPAGWRLDVAFSDGRAWLNITTPAGSSACLSATHKTGNGDDTIAAQILAYLRDDLAHPAPQPKRCPYCDDTGDVHSADGEWRGACTCPAGASPQPTPPQQAAPEQTAKMVPAGVAFSDLFMEQFEALAGSVTSDIIKDAARLAAACAYSLAATPPQPTAPAPQAQAVNEGRTNRGDETGGTVKRFGWGCTGNKPEIIPATNGAFVWYSDYLELFRKGGRIGCAEGADMTIKVFQLDDCDWWAGESLEACIEAGREACGKGCYEDAEEEGYQVSDEAMRELKIRRDEDGGGELITFEAYLAELIAAGEKFPMYFASTEF